MLALIQKLITCGLLFLSLGIGAWFARNGQFAVGLAATVACLLMCFGGYAGALAVEFALARSVNARTGLQAPTFRQIRWAWWHEAITGPVLFCWRQPFRTHAVPDNLLMLPKQSGQQGVVFVHGFFCNRAFWSPWMSRLKTTGRVFHAVSLEPVFGSIDDYRRTIGDAVLRVTAATGMPPLLVCHSMGGLAVRAWLAQQPADGPAYHVVTMGTPHRGTWLARWGRSTNAREMQLDSPWLAGLNTAYATPPLHRFTCWYSDADNIVFPSASATLPGADNRALQGVAHVQMAFLPRVMDETLALLQ